MTIPCFTAKRIGSDYVIYKSDSLSLFVRQQRAILEFEGSGPRCRLCPITGLPSSLFSFLAKCDSRLDVAVRPKRTIHAGFFSSSSSFPSDNARRAPASRTWSMDLYLYRRRRSRLRKRDVVRHSVCWSRSLSVFFNRRGMTRLREYFSNVSQETRGEKRRWNAYIILII